MNTKVLEYIVAIAEEQSVSRAAERFYLSHPALSGHLKKLEKELGTALFQRTSKGMQPTPAGLIFLADARAILHQEEKLRQSLALMRQQRNHTIRVMVDAPFYNRFIRDVMPRFSALRPEYTVDAAKCNALQARAELAQGRATLGVLLSTSQQMAGLVYLPFYSSCLRLIFPKDYTGRKDIRGLKEALDSGMLMSLNPTGSTLNMIVLQRLAAFQIYPEHTMEGDTRTIIEHIKTGNTCCVLPEFFRADLEQVGLTIGEEFAPFYHVLAYSSETAQSPAVQDLMRLMIESYSF